MKTFEMDCFEVTESEGDGVRSRHVAFVSNQALADTLVDRQAGWRNVTPYKKLLVVFDTIEEFDANTKEALRKTALAKLSPAEREALGLL